VIQSYVNNLAIGTVEKPGHWNCPVKMDKRSTTTALLMDKPKGLMMNLLVSLTRL
jgi:hypothetical protein